MENKAKLKENLSLISHDELVEMYIQQAEQSEKMQQQISNLQQTVTIINQQRFGRKTEKLTPPDGQIGFESIVIIWNIPPISRGTAFPSATL